MAAVLYFGFDDKLPEILGKFFEMRKADAGEINSLTRAADQKKFEEALDAITFEVVYIDQAALNKPPIEWLSSLKKRKPNFSSPVILTGLERDPSKIMKLIEAGFSDYHVNPPDKPLVLEKFKVYATGHRDSSLKQVYSLKMSQAADLAHPGFLEDLSEFECHVRTSHPVPLGDMIILYAESFSSAEGVRGSVLCRCSAAAEHPSFKGQFQVTLYFVGPTPEVLTDIRNALRKAYVAGKAQS